MQKENPLISVIIPVYQVEEYLNRCMESVLGQTYKNLQIILVDDGSTDRSGSLCDQWAAGDRRVEVIHQANAGLGMARNRGLMEMRGDYVAFVDSDDYVRLDMFEVLVKTLETEGGEVCYGGYVEVLADGTQITQTVPEKLHYEEKEIWEFAAYVLGAPPERTQKIFAGMSVWGNLYAASLFTESKLCFQNERTVLCEDLLFNLTVFQKIKKLVVTTERLYYYCENAASLSKRYRPDRFEAALRMHQALEEELRDAKREYPKLGQRMIRNYMDNLIVCMRQEVAFRKKNGRSFCLARLKEMCGREETQRLLRHYPVKRMEKKQRILFSMVERQWAFGVYWLFRLRYKL